MPIHVHCVSPSRPRPASNTASLFSWGGSTGCFKNTVYSREPSRTGFPGTEIFSALASLDKVPSQTRMNRALSGRVAVWPRWEAPAAQGFLWAPVPSGSLRRAVGSPGPGLVSALIFRGEPGGFSLAQYSSPASVEAFFQQKPEPL